MMTYRCHFLLVFTSQAWERVVNLRGMIHARLSWLLTMVLCTLPSFHSALCCCSFPDLTIVRISEFTASAFSLSFFSSDSNVTCASCTAFIASCLLASIVSAMRMCPYLNYFVDVFIWVAASLDAFANFSFMRSSAGTNPCSIATIFPFMSASSCFVRS